MDTPPEENYREREKYVPMPCCQKCYGRQGTLAGGGIYCNDNACPCHTQPAKVEGCSYCKSGEGHDHIGVPEKAGGWRERFAKLWRESEQRGYDTYDPFVDFIASELISQKDELRRKVEGMKEPKVQPNGGLTKKHVMYIKALSDVLKLLED